MTFRNHIEQLEAVPENTLDEPVWMTFFSELKHIAQKFRHVLVPNADSSHRRVIRKLDLWGPFLMCMVLGLLLDSNGTIDLDANQFLVLLLAVFVGATVVTFNSRVLGAKISFLQSVSMLGYCVFPLFLAALLIRLFRVVKVRSLALSLGLVGVCAFWSIMGTCVIYEAARAYLGVSIPPEKKFISLYPVLLFYIFIGSFAVFI